MDSVITRCTLFKFDLLFVDFNLKYLHALLSAYMIRVQTLMTYIITPRYVIS